MLRYLRPFSPNALLKIPPWPEKHLKSDDAKRTGCKAIVSQRHLGRTETLGAGEPYSRWSS